MVAGLLTAAVLLFCAGDGLIRGGVRAIWSIGCVLLSIILSLALNPAVTEFMTSQVHLDHYIESNMSEYLLEQADKSDDEQVWKNQAKNQQDVLEQKQIIKGLDLPSSWKRALIRNNTVENYGKMAVEGFIGYIAASVASMGVRTLSFLITYLLVFILLHVLSGALHIVEHLPVIRQLNKVAGLGIGLVKGLLIIWVIMIAIAFFKSYGFGNLLWNQVMLSPFAAFFYRHNLLALAFASVF